MKIIPDMKPVKFSVLLLSVILMFSCNGNGTAGVGNTGPGNSAVVKITKADFISKVFDYENNKEWKFNGDLPCIVDFYADWCKPCKMISPYLDELASSYSGKIRVYKVNIDQEKELAKAFQIQSIPAMLYIPLKGQPQMSVGALQKEEYEKIVKEFLLQEKAK